MELPLIQLVLLSLNSSTPQGGLFVVFFLWNIFLVPTYSYKELIEREKQYFFLETEIGSLKEEF
jgi:hypothetical protein